MNSGEAKSVKRVFGVDPPASAIENRPRDSMASSESCTIRSAASRAMALASGRTLISGGMDMRVSQHPRGADSSFPLHKRCDSFAPDLRIAKSNHRINSDVFKQQPEHQQSLFVGAEHLSLDQFDLLRRQLITLHRILAPTV